MTQTNDSPPPRVSFAGLLLLVPLVGAAGCAGLYGGKRSLPKVPSPLSGASVDKSFPSKAMANGWTCGDTVPDSALRVTANQDQVCVEMHDFVYLPVGGLKSRPEVSDYAYSIFVDTVQSKAQPLVATEQPKMLTRCETEKGRVEVWRVNSSGCFASPRLTPTSDLLAVYQSVQELGAWYLEPSGTVAR